MKKNAGRHHQPPNSEPAGIPFQHTYEHGDTLLRMGLKREVIHAEITASQAKGD